MGSLSAYSPFVGIRCSAQLCQAVLIRQPANPHKHLMGFVSRSVEVSEGRREGGRECAHKSAELRLTQGNLRVREMEVQLPLYFCHNG